MQCTVGWRKIYRPLRYSSAKMLRMLKTRANNSNIITLYQNQCHSVNIPLDLKMVFPTVFPVLSPFSVFCEEKTLSTEWVLSMNGETLLGYSLLSKYILLTETSNHHLKIIKLLSINIVSSMIWMSPEKDQDILFEFLI